jgi:hypothetical protein
MYTYTSPASTTLAGGATGGWCTPLYLYLNRGVQQSSSYRQCNYPIERNKIQKEIKKTYHVQMVYSRSNGISLKKR